MPIIPVEGTWFALVLGLKSLLECPRGINLHRLLDLHQDFTPSGVKRDFIVKTIYFLSFWFCLTILYSSLLDLLGFIVLLMIASKSMYIFAIFGAVFRMVRHFMMNFSLMPLCPIPLVTKNKTTSCLSFSTKMFSWLNLSTYSTRNSQSLWANCSLVGLLLLPMK